MKYKIEDKTMRVKTTIKLLFLTLLIPVTVFAETPSDVVAELQHDWAIANYQLSGDEQIKAYEALIDRANAAVDSNPRSAEILVWNGIIKSAFAGVKGGVGALGLAKQAKKSLEASMKLDDKALNGSAYASLGTLYFKVPGWPLGFGNDKKAVQLLEKALEINPDGIDPNYFYADYLREKKDFENAEKYLLKAQKAAPRADRPVADSGRQQEILTALLEVREKLGRVGS
jgi:tetratricopeptide (TPR) repeat protein